MEAPLESISVFVTSILKNSYMKYHSQMKYTSLPAPSVIEFTFSYTSVSLTYVFFFKRHPSISKRVTKTFIKIISLYAYNFFDGFCATTMGKTWDSVEQSRSVDTVTLSQTENFD